MKKGVFVSAAALTLMLGLNGPARARTWTSADGERTFEATFRSFDPGTGMVTVLKANGTAMTFSQDKLSEEDREFLKTADSEAAVGGGASRAEEIEESLSKQVIGSKILNAKLHRLDGKRFRKAELDKAPEYYILYYSASW